MAVALESFTVHACSQSKLTDIIFRYLANASASSEETLIFEIPLIRSCRNMLVSAVPLLGTLGSTEGLYLSPRPIVHETWDKPVYASSDVGVCLLQCPMIVLFLNHKRYPFLCAPSEAIASVLSGPSSIRRNRLTPGCLTSMSSTSTSFFVMLHQVMEFIEFTDLLDSLVPCSSLLTVYSHIHMRLMHYRVYFGSMADTGSWTTGRTLLAPWYCSILQISLTRPHTHMQHQSPCNVTTPLGAPDIPSHQMISRGRIWCHCHQQHIPHKIMHFHALSSRSMTHLLSSVTKLLLCCYLE